MKINKPLLKRPWFLLFLGSIFLLAAIIIILPIGAKYYLKGWLLDNGADKAVIEKILFNPFTGKIGLQGVTVETGGTTVLADADMSVNIAMLQLFHRHAVIQQSSLNGVTLDIKLYNDGRMRIGSYTTPPPLEKSREKSDSQNVLWIFAANRIEMNNCTLRFSMPDLQLNLHINRASLTKFTTAPGDKSGALTLDATVNDAPVILDLQTLRIAPDIVAQGTVKIDHFALGNLAAFLKSSLHPFTGAASVDGKGMFRMAADGDIFVDYDGMLEVDKGHIAGTAFTVKGAPVYWQKGKIHFAMTEKSGIVVDVDGRLTGKDVAVDIPDPLISIREPDIRINGKVHVGIDDEIQVDADAGLELKKINFSMPPLAAEAQSLSWKGSKRRIQFNSGTRKKPLSLIVKGQFIADSPMFQDQDKKLNLVTKGKVLSWIGNVRYVHQPTSGISTQIKTQGQLSATDIDVSLPDVLRYRQEICANTGQVDITIKENGPLLLHLDHIFTGKKIAVDLAGPQLSLNQQSINITDKGSISLNKQIAVKGTGSIKANGFTIKKTGQKIPLAALKNFTVESIQAPGGSNISIQKASGDGVAVHINGKMPLNLSIPEIIISDVQSGDLATCKIEKITAQSPGITSSVNGKPLAGLNSLEIRRITAGVNRKVSVDRVNFDDLYFLGKSPEKKENICTIGGARLSKIGWNPASGLTGQSLSFSDLYCTLVREKNGDMIVGKRLAAMRDPRWKPAKVKDKSTKKQAAANLSLAQITLRGKSGIHFEDHTLAVPFISNLDIRTLQVKGLNSAKPEKAATIKMAGSLEKRAPLTIDGTIAPFLKELALKLQISLKNYPLSHLSAYTVQSVGVALASGSLRLTSDISLKNRQLDMQNKILLKQLKTSTISKELADKLDNQLPIPLESALSILKDRNDTISLDVPLSGPIDKLSIGISDILITALGKAIVPAASGYLVYALGPYGALAWVGMEVGSKILEVRLPPVQFKPGDDQLPKGSEDYFKRLAKILQDKPEADFRLCPKSCSWEFFADKDKEQGKKDEMQTIALSDDERKKLMELGQKRAANIKDYLVEKYNVDKDRLLICITRIEEKKSAVPRVDIRM